MSLHGHIHNALSRAEAAWDWAYMSEVACTPRQRLALKRLSYGASVLGALIFGELSAPLKPSPWAMMGVGAVGATAGCYLGSLFWKLSLPKLMRYSLHISSYESQGINMTIKRLWQRSTRIFNPAARLHLKTVRTAKAADAARVRQAELLEPFCEWSDFYWQSISERWSNPATTLREKEALKSAYAHMINLYTSGNEAARQADAALQDLRPKLDKQWQDGPTPDAAVENFRAVDKIMNTYSILTSHMIEFVEMIQIAFHDKRNEDQVCETLDRLHAQLAVLPSAPAQLKVTVKSDALRP